MNHALILHAVVLAALLAGLFILPDYHQGNVARIMVLACFAMGYNIAFGYTGLLSLGHAIFFAAGVYAAGLGVVRADWPAWAGLLAGPLAGAGLAIGLGLLALRTQGVAFMIVTLMFAQAAYLVTAYFGEVTRADEGFVIGQSLRQIAGIDLGNPDNRYIAAWCLLAICLSGTFWLARSRFGRVMVAVRENEPRAQMLGYDTFRVRLSALVLSGAMAGAAGAAYALLFGYVGNTFASIQYSILPLLWVLLGGAGTTLGPLLGVALMFYMIDIASSDVMPWLAEQAETSLGIDASGLASGHMILVGILLVGLVLYAPKGVLGTVRQRFLPWLP